MRAGWAILTSFLIGGCGWISFRKPPTDDELRVERELRLYYTEVKRSFAVGNPQALASLFDASITRPMSKPEIERWSEDFFKAHGRASFTIQKFELDELGADRAVVTIRYRVDTPDGKGSFAGVESDELVKRNGRWYIAGWEKLPEGR
jgi:hypothetical protein